MENHILPTCLHQAAEGSSRLRFIVWEHRAQVFPADDCPPKDLKHLKIENRQGASHDAELNTARLKQLTFDHLGGA